MSLDENRRMKTTATNKKAKLPKHKHISKNHSNTVFEYMYLILFFQRLDKIDKICRNG